MFKINDELIEKIHKLINGTTLMLCPANIAYSCQWACGDNCTTGCYNSCLNGCNTSCTASCQNWANAK